MSGNDTLLDTTIRLSNCYMGLLQIHSESIQKVNEFLQKEINEEQLCVALILRNKKLAEELKNSHEILTNIETRVLVQKSLNI